MNIGENLFSVKGVAGCFTVPDRAFDWLLDNAGKDAFIICMYLLRHRPESFPTLKELKAVKVGVKGAKAGVDALRDAGILVWKPPAKIGEKSGYVLDLDLLRQGRVGEADGEFETDDIEKELVVRSERSNEELLRLPPSLRKRDDATIDAALAVWDAWLSTLGDDDNVGRRRLTHDRWGRIRTAMRWGYTSEELIKAVKGWPYDPWELRINFKDFKHLLKSDENIEKFIKLYEAGSAGKPVVEKWKQPEKDPYRKLGTWE